MQIIVVIYFLLLFCWFFYCGGRFIFYSAMLLFFFCPAVLPIHVFILFANSLTWSFLGINLLEVLFEHYDGTSAISDTLVVAGFLGGNGGYLEQDDPIVESMGGLQEYFDYLDNYNSDTSV